MVHVVLEELDLSGAERWQRFKLELQHKNHQGAEDICRGAIALGDSGLRWRLGLAWVELARGQIHDALASAMRLVREYPNEVELHRTVAEIWLILGKPALAYEWAKMGQQLEPSAMSTAFLGRMRRALDGAQAAEDLREAPRTEMIRVRVSEDFTDQTAPGGPPRPRPVSPVRVVRVPDTEARMRALLGQSLFGDRDVSTSVGPDAGFAQLATAISRRRAVFAGIAVVMVLGAASVVRAAITHRAGEDATKEVDTLAHLMETGSVEQVKAAIPRFEALAATAGAATPANRAALARGEATVYRYLGAEPERKAKVEALLASPDLTGDDAVLARALITGDEERGAMLEELRDFAARHPKDSEPVYLMACAHAALGEKRLATKEMKRAEELEPSHLPHLLGALSFFANGKHKDEALRIFELMNDVQPNSAFTVEAMKQLAARGWL